MINWQNNGLANTSTKYFTEDIKLPHRLGATNKLDIERKLGKVSG